MRIETNIPLLEAILAAWKAELGNDETAYKGHVYRLVHFCVAIHPCRDDDWDKIVIAACFHDLGIWSDRTVDYLQPSIDLARDYLDQHGHGDWLAEIALMINFHHKLLPYSNPDYPLVESFRKADLVDISLGMIRFGLPKEDVNAVRGRFPNAGFHKRLGQLTWQRFKEKPWSPLPMMKW